MTQSTPGAKRMPLKPDARAAASKQLGDAHEAALEALLLPDGEKQVEAWRMAANAAGEAHRACIGAVRVALEKAERKGGR